MLQVMPGHALTGRRIESRHALTAFTTNQSNHNCLPGRGSGSDPSSGTWRTPAEASNSQKETEKEVEQLEPSRVARSVAAAAPHAGVPCGRCCRQLLLLPLPLYSVGRLAVPLPHHQQHNVGSNGTVTGHTGILTMAGQQQQQQGVCQQHSRQACRVAAHGVPPAGSSGSSNSGSSRHSSSSTEHSPACTPGSRGGSTGGRTSCSTSMENWQALSAPAQAQVATARATALPAAGQLPGAA